MIQEYQASRDAETIPITRGELTRLLVRCYVAEGMTIAKAEVAAQRVVDATFSHLRTTYRMDGSQRWQA